MLRSDYQAVCIESVQNANKVSASIPSKVPQRSIRIERESRYSVTPPFILIRHNATAAVQRDAAL